MSPSKAPRALLPLWLPESGVPELSLRDSGATVAALFAVPLFTPLVGSSLFQWLFSAVGVPFLVGLTVVTSLAGIPAGIHYARGKELPPIGRAAFALDISVNALTAFWCLLVLPWLNQMASTAWKRLGPFDAHIVVWLGFALVVILLAAKLWLYRVGGRPVHRPAMKSQRAGWRWQLPPAALKEWRRFAAVVAVWVILISVLRVGDERHGWPELAAWLGVVFGGAFLARFAVRIKGHGLRLGLLWGLLAGGIAQEVHEFDRLGQMAPYEILGIALVLVLSVAWNGLLAYAVERYFLPRAETDKRDSAFRHVAR